MGRSIVVTFALCLAFLASISHSVAGQDAATSDSMRAKVDGEDSISRLDSGLDIRLDEDVVDSFRMEVFDDVTKEGLYDTGLVHGHHLQVSVEDQPWLSEASSIRYEIRAWDAEGELVLSQVSFLPNLGDNIVSIGFDLIPGDTVLFADHISLDGDVDVAGTLNAIGIGTSELNGSGGGAFFDSCASGSAIQSIGPAGEVVCEDEFAGDDLGNHRATQNLQFVNPREGITAPGGAKFRTGPLGSTWFAQAGASGRYRFGARSFDAPNGDRNGDFVIDENGNVGIFTFEPTARLDVRSLARIGTPDGEAAPTSFVDIDGGGGTPFIDFLNDGSPSNDFDMRLILTGDDSLTIDGGRLGVGGTMTNPQYKIDLPNNPNPDGQGRANDWMTYSSARYKSNIKTIPEALQIVSNLRGVEFNWSADPQGKKDLGFIAEEVGVVLPELVDWDDNGVDAKAMSYIGVIPVLVEAMKEQLSLLELQQKRIKLLEEEFCATRTSSSLCP